jgi:hypothetical protein
MLGKVPHDALKRTRSVGPPTQYIGSWSLATIPENCKLAMAQGQSSTRATEDVILREPVMGASIMRVSSLRVGGWSLPRILSMWERFAIKSFARDRALAPGRLEPELEPGPLWLFEAWANGLFWPLEPEPEPELEPHDRLTGTACSDIIMVLDNFW